MDEKEKICALPILETRKIHPLGDGGLAVLLPKQWAEKQNIEKGDDVLVLADGRIVIEKPTDKRIQEIQKGVDDIIEERGEAGGKRER